jgi:hypothetical protein
MRTVLKNKKYLVKVLMTLKAEINLVLEEQRLDSPSTLGGIGCVARLMYIASATQESS